MMPAGEMRRHDSDTDMPADEYNPLTEEWVSRGSIGSIASMSRENMGYIYALTNEFMPGLVKIGRTDRNPELRAKELFTTGVPVPFKIQIAKRVKDPIEKEKLLHSIMGRHEVDEKLRKREFFRSDIDSILELFELIDGEIWQGETVDVEVRHDDSAYYEISFEGKDYLEGVGNGDIYDCNHVKVGKWSNDCDDIIWSTEIAKVAHECHKGAIAPKTRAAKRKMGDEFTDGQEIRHVLKGHGLGSGKCLYAIYDSDNNMIVCKADPAQWFGGESYKSLSAFALAHAKLYRPDAQPATFSGWVCTEKLLPNGNWVRADGLST